MKKSIFIFIIAIVCAFTSYAQNQDKVNQTLPVEEQSTNRTTNKMIYFVPQYLFIDGTRMEFEYRKNVSNAFLFSGTFYTGTLNNNSLLGESDDTWSGANIEILHKIYLADVLPKLNKSSDQIYLAHGPYYQHANIKYQGNSWVPSTVNNLDVLEYKYGEQTMTINKIGYSAILGVQIVTESRLVVDIYTGLGFRHAYVKKTSDENDQKTYNDNWLTPAYSGNILLLGFKLGVVL